MKVVITDFALTQIKAIHQYYKKNASKSVADKLAGKVLDTIDALESMPKVGTVEVLLRRLKLNHRYIITGYYKIIFRVENDVLYVTDIFDTRQNPGKIIRRNKG